jgi:hypothetical protein
VACLTPDQQHPSLAGTNAVTTRALQARLCFFQDHLSNSRRKLKFLFQHSHKALFRAFGFNSFLYVVYYHLFH